MTLGEKLVYNIISIKEGKNRIRFLAPTSKLNTEYDDDGVVRTKRRGDQCVSIKEVSPGSPSEKVFLNALTLLLRIYLNRYNGISYLICHKEPARCIQCPLFFFCSRVRNLSAGFISPREWKYLLETFCGCTTENDVFLLTSCLLDFLQVTRTELGIAGTKSHIFGPLSWTLDGKTTDCRYGAIHL